MICWLKTVFKTNVFVCLVFYEVLPCWFLLALSRVVLVVVPVEVHPHVSIRHNVHNDRHRADEQHLPQHGARV